jgi:hypothetical protein
LAVTLVLWPAPPAVKVSEVGARLREKLGGGVVTVSATDVAWLRVPEVPVKVIVAFPATAVAVAVSVIFWAAPGVRFKVEGVTLTPVGRPEAATDTVPEKLLTAVAVTLIDTPAPPVVTVTVPGVAAREKSA